MLLFCFPLCIAVNSIVAKLRMADTGGRFKISLMKRKSPDAIHVWLVLNKAFQAITRHAAAGIQQAGLGDSDFRVLEVLLHKGPLPVNTIGPKVNLTPGSISVAVDRLYAKGLVSRIESAEDRRIRIVALTPNGKKLSVRVKGAPNAGQYLSRPVGQSAGCSERQFLQLVPWLQEAESRKKARPGRSWRLRQKTLDDGGWSVGMGRRSGRCRTTSSLYARRYTRPQP